MASRAPELSETVRLLGPTAANARLGFASIERALPPEQRVRPRADPWGGGDAGHDRRLRAVAGPGRAAVRAGELGGLLEPARPRHPPTSRGSDTGTRAFLPEVDLFNRCSNEVLLPTARPARGRRAAVRGCRELQGVLVRDGRPGRRGAGLRRQRHVPAPRGARRRPDDQSGKTNYTGEPLFGKVTTPPLRTRPAFPGNPPPLAPRRAAATATRSPT